MRYAIAHETFVVVAPVSVIGVHHDFGAVIAQRVNRTPVVAMSLRDDNRLSGPATSAKASRRGGPQRARRH